MHNCSTASLIFRRAQTFREQQRQQQRQYHHHHHHRCKNDEQTAIFSM